MVQTVFHRGRAERKLTPELTPLVKKKEARQGDHLSGLFRGQVAGKLQGATTKKEKQPYERRREEGEAGTDKGGASVASPGKREGSFLPERVAEKGEVW